MVLSYVTSQTFEQVEAVADVAAISVIVGAFDGERALDWTCDGGSREVVVGKLLDVTAPNLSSKVQSSVNVADVTNVMQGFAGMACYH